MDTADLVSAAVGIGGVLVALLAYFKYKPGQREAVDMAFAQANMNVAQGTFEMVTTELEDQFKRMAAEVKELHQALVNQRHEEALYRADVDKRLAELGAELRAAKAEARAMDNENKSLTRENRRLKTQVAENDLLKARVKQLEDEVRALKSGRAS